MNNDTSYLLEQWKTVISAQMHFNDMLIRARSLACTVVIGVFGAAAAMVSQYPITLIQICSVKLHVSTIIIFFGLVLLTCVFFLDFLYYYQLLLAAVEHGEQIENRISRLADDIDNKDQARLTRYLSHKVSRERAKIILFLFYGIPFIVGSLFLLYLLLGYKV